MPMVRTGALDHEHNMKQREGIGYVYVLSHLKQQSRYAVSHGEDVKPGSLCYYL